MDSHRTPGDGSFHEPLYDGENSSVDEILDQRAKKLAVSHLDEESEEDGIEILEFLLSGERYAIDMQYIREVALLKEITFVPGVPPFILGIISLHGSVLSIVDLRTVLGMPPKGLTDYNRIIVLSGGTMTFGILADAIVRTMTISTILIKKPPPTIRGQGAPYLTGILPGPLMIIDAHALLSDPNMVIGDE
ncbi:MAG: chemotaxis protein CheW [Methanospirillum sp.]|uniref:chemotaxis protein CheW n=1 Tax=Methanospirillum sp. TaxID=45200 RepID=UPI002372602F|nr:chemotaxis protein CheW [Methanospirillum sp.]MDD1727513.1 chemotaxis protein CheW [Methanospirillum sp.]